MSIKTALKRRLERSGWYVRKTAGLPIGIDLFSDLDNYGVRPKCILDVGAHYGETSLEYLARFDRCRIFAFEPVSSNFSKLVEAVSPHSAIEPVNFAAGDQTGRMEIWLNPKNTGANSLIPAAGAKTESINVVTIDDFCRERRVSPDFIKLDVEGYELKAIAGARQTLSDPALKALVTEATFDPANRAHTQIADLVDTLKPLGLYLVAMHDQCQWQSTKQLQFFNGLFVKR